MRPSYSDFWDGLLLGLPHYQCFQCFHMFAIFAFINGYALFIKYGVLENPPFSSIIFNYGGFFFAACVCVFFVFGTSKCCSTLNIHCSTEATHPV